MNTNFANVLQSLIETSGKTQNLISKELNIPRQQLSNWKTGYIEPNIDNLILLANYFNITVDELIGRSEQAIELKEHNFTTQQQNKAVAFSNEYSVLIEDNNFQNIAKLCNNITPELRAVVLGYLIGFLQSQGVNTQNILRY